ncbi:MAG: HAD hydrolase-like protein, partial [Clostridia bacterium]|nr:HAD hydrolase-like protein [Clostridia bacterium]
MRKFRKRCYIFDIDGTIKDIVGENVKALERTLKVLNINTFKTKLILFINSIAMWFVKTGILPTNRNMQETMLEVYSILLKLPKENFKYKYYYEYCRKSIFFPKVLRKMKKLKKQGNKIYLISTNLQNITLLEAIDYRFFDKGYIMQKSNTTKKQLYTDIIIENSLSKEDVIIIGDNIFDDIIQT